MVSVVFLPPPEVTLPMKIEYARVSTLDQNLNLQIDALKKAGCTDTYIYREQITGSTMGAAGVKEDS